MPKLTEEQINSYISQGKITAISVDTAIFDKYNCNLNFLTLKKLDQFKKSGVKLLLSEIIVQEVKKHIAIAAAETQRSLRSALKKHADRWKPDVDLDSIKASLKIETDASLVAEEQLGTYLVTIGAEIVRANNNGDLTEQVLDHYFNVRPPFEEKKDKKNEFPDAFALLSLEQEAKDLNTLILCISPDKGWGNFAEASDHLIVVSDLNLVLSWFNDHGRIITERAVALWKDDKAPNLDSAIESAFEYYLDGLQFDIEGHAPVDYEAEPLGAVLQYLDKSKIQSPTVVAEDEDVITFMVRATAKISFEADFNFYAYDSMDGDDIGLGSENANTEDDLTFEITISIGRDFDGDSLDEIEVNISPRRILVDFGYVDPFPDDDPTFEKY